MSVRLKRLTADYEKVRTLFQGDERITLTEHHGRPPERYVLQYTVRSLQEDLSTNKLEWANSFMVEINLPGSYPRTAPQCRMLTPAYHPNIAPHSICIGDHWAAGESLSNLITRIGEMLAYQSYNIKSPLNGHAAQWADQNKNQIPTDNFDFSSILTKSEPIVANQVTAEQACMNCGAAGHTNTLQVCMNDHIACDACLLPCHHCQKNMCLACELKKCDVCGKATCTDCRVMCAMCGVVACMKDATRCTICKEIHCRNCLVQCIECNSFVCINHMNNKKSEDGRTATYCDSCGHV